jgi:DinB superfamily
MAEATAEAMKTNIAAAFDKYIAQLEGTGSVWEKKPTNAAEGEDAWSARQVAEHIAGANTYFGAGIAGIIGVEAPKMSQPKLSNAAEAVAATRETYGQLNGVVVQVKDDQLGLEIDHPRLGKQTVGSLLTIVSGHLSDHAQQLESLAGG